MTTKEAILTTLKLHKPSFEKMGISTLGLFGSYARSEQTSASDIDLLIDFQRDQETFDNFMAAYDYLESLFRNEKVEIVTKNGLNKYIGPKILKDVMYV